MPPLNLVGDFGGGGMLLALGVVCALFETQRSGQGQVIDAAMVDGSALLMSMMHGFRAMGIWDDERGVNLLDTGAGFYDVYETADGRYLAVGALESQFYAELLAGLGLADDPDLPKQMDRSTWPELTNAVRRGDPHPHPRRVGGRLRRHRRLRGARAVDGRGSRAPPQRGPGHLRRALRGGPGGAGAPLRAHAGHPRPARPPSPVSTPTRCWRSGASAPVERDELRAGRIVA